jgi:radical SAM superfamily enzyme YgiQ (UPF0313 family)
MAAIEQGPIRPPSEAHSLLLRITRNCSWNRCEFCHIYKGQKFSPRTVEEVKKDIDTVKEIVSEIKSISWNLGYGGEIHAALAGYILKSPQQYANGYRSILLWLLSGAATVFLQDANNLIIRTKNLVEILNHLKQTFPSVNRITTYSRARTVARKSADELRALRDAGLSRIHMGLESGHDPILEYVQKGVTAGEHIDAGKKIKESGISLSEYIMPGIGGKSMWREHAVETAKVLNQIDPDFIRVRTLKVLSIMPLYRKIENGEFELLSDDEMIEEQKLLIENLDGITSMFTSDHILNLLEELEGKFPEAKEPMLAVINRYLALSQSERENFRLGRRAGFYRSLDDMENTELRSRVDAIMRRVEKQHPGELDRVISELMESFL